MTLNNLIPDKFSEITLSLAVIALMVLKLFNFLARGASKAPRGG